MRYMISDYEICESGYEQSGIVISQRVFGYEICD